MESKVFIIIHATALIAMAQTGDAKSRKFSFDRDDRIIGGRYAEHGEWPSLVAISFSPGRSSCGGNILSSQFILTACHCTISLEGENEPDSAKCTKSGSYLDLRIVAGSISRVPYEYQGFQVRFVYNWMQHPKCARSAETGEWFYDIAVIRLSEELIYNELVKPIALPTDQTAFRKMVAAWQQESKECQVAGWGFTGARLVAHGVEEALNASEYLKVLDMELMKPDDCFNELCKYERVYSRHNCMESLRYYGTDRICAVPRYTQNGSVCGGDSGGALSCDDIVVGVVSYGEQCSDLEAPIIFARVDAALPFILPFLESAEPRNGQVSILRPVNDILLIYVTALWRLITYVTSFFCI